MVQFIVRSGGFRRFAETNGSPIVLDQPTDLSLNLTAKQIASMTRTGDNLVLQLINGEQVVLQDYFVSFVGGARNRLFLSNNGDIQEVTFEETFGRMNTAEFQTANGNGDLMFDGGANLGVETTAQVVDASVQAGTQTAGGFNIDGNALAWVGGGLLLAGLAAAAGGGSSSTPDTTAPNDPVITTNTSTGVSGTAEPGSTVTVTVGSIVYTETVGSDGTFSIVFTPAVADGTTVNVVVTDPSGNSTDPTVVTIDAVAPNAPVVTSATLTLVSGTAEPGSTVGIDTDGSGTANVTVVVAADGTWSIPFNPGLTEGASISVTSTDSAGNTSTATSYVIDTIAPTTAIVDTINGTEVTGTAEPGSTVSVSVAGGATIDVVVAADGTYTVPFGTSVSDGTGVVVTVTDPSGNVSAPIAVTVDAVAPATPTTTNIGPNTASGSGAEVGATVHIDINNDGISDGTAVVAADGTWDVDYATFTPPAGPLADGTTVSISLEDTNGNISATGTPFLVDATAPTSSVDSNTPTTLTVTVSEPATMTVYVNGVATSFVQTLASSGSHTLTVPTGLYADGDTVTISVSDAAGNIGNSLGYTVDLATVDPSALVSNGSQISGMAEAGALVTITVNGGMHTVTANGSGAWTLLESAATGTFLDGTSFTMSSTDASTNVSNTVNGQISTAPIVGAISTPSGGGPTEITGTASAGDTIELFYVDGSGSGMVINDLASSGPADANGDWSLIANPPITANEEVFVGVVDGSPDIDVDGEAVLDLTYTLIMRGPGETIDLAAVQLPANENTSDVAYGVQNLDVGAIDLSSNVGNGLIVDQASIASLSDEGDALRVDGVAGNSITINGGSDSGQDTMINGQHYDVYDMGAGVTLYVDQDITVI